MVLSGFCKLITIKQQQLNQRRKKAGYHTLNDRRSDENNTEKQNRKQVFEQSW